MKNVAALQQTLPGIQSEITALRQGVQYAADPQAAKDLSDAASDLQNAYNKQKAMMVDLQSMTQTMMDMNLDQLPHSLGGNSVHESQLPADMKDMKLALRFDGRRDVIAQAESDAADTALDAATAHCGSH